MSEFFEQMHVNTLKNCGYNDGQAYGGLYALNSTYGGIPLDEQIKIIADIVSKEYTNPDDKLYYEAYQRGFKDRLRIP
jgi:hypothetical protein